MGCRIGSDIAEVETATAFVHGGTPPRQPPPAVRTLVHENAAVDRACCNETEIPDSPPDRALSEAYGAQAWPAVVQVIGANPISAERSLVESVSSVDGAVAHRSPLLRIEAQRAGNLPDAAFPVESGARDPGDLRQGERPEVSMLISDAAKIATRALVRHGINAKQQTGTGLYTSPHACSSRRSFRCGPPCGTKVRALGRINGGALAESNLSVKGFDRPDVLTKRARQTTATGYAT